MRKAVRYTIAALLLTATTFGVQAVASADSKVLTVTPATTKPVIDPGSSATGSFQIINQGAGDYPVSIYSAPYSVRTEDYTPDFTPIRGKSDAASWIHFGTAESNIKPSQSLTVGYTITVPAATQPGGYYAVAFVQAQTSGPKQGVVINERVGEIFYIQVAGPVKQSGKLLSWSSSFLQMPPLSADLRLENGGGVHYPADISVSVQDIFGRAKYNLNTNKEVLPQTIRRVPVVWSNAPPIGLFKVTGTTTILGTKHTLATKYVLVVAPLARIVGGALFAALILGGLSRQILRRKLQSKKASSD